MSNWLARLFGNRSRPRQEALFPTAVPAPPSVVDALPAIDLDLAFYRWVSGASAHVGDAPEQLILDELARLARQPETAAELVPRVPAVIPQLLRSLRDENMSAADLARQVAQDFSLVAEVIREVNTPYYRPSAPVRNIEGALLLLGQNGLRMLLARVAFRPVISAQAGRLARQAAPQVWSQSEKCAMAAALAAPGCGASPFEAYLAGLMQNVGLIVAFRLADQLAGTAPLPAAEGFARALLDRARTLSARIALLWELPPAVGAAIGQAGQAAQADATPLARALREGDRLARLRVLADAGVEGAQALAATLEGERQRIYDQLHSARE